MNGFDTSTAPREASLYGIGAVSSITGISETTLRVWERRYAFPRSLRTVGGHRQYTEAEVLRLQWVKTRLDDGMRVRKAIRLFDATAQETAIAAALYDPLHTSNSPTASLVTAQKALLGALLAYDSTTAYAVIAEAATQHALDQVVLELIGPTLESIGESWSVGAIDVATEHFASNLLRHQMLAWIRASAPTYQAPPVVLACAPTELHEGSLLMLGVLLRRLRWPVLYLGQSLPMEDLTACVERVRPSLIVFVAMIDAAAETLIDWPQWLPQPASAATRPIVGYGGRAFNQDPLLCERVPGVYLGTTLAEGSQRIHRLLLALNVLHSANVAEQ